MSDDTVINRCGWSIKEPLYTEYHDREWGYPQRDRIRLFEMLSLGVTQCGLSWSIVFKRREYYRNAFCQFNIESVAKYNNDDIDRLMKDSQLIRNKGKLEAIVNNAKMILALEEKMGITFQEYLWSFVGHNPILNNRDAKSPMATRSDESDKMAESLKSHGFKFTGSTICYAFMQTVGMVNDHHINCIARNNNHNSIPTPLSTTASSTTITNTTITTKITKQKPVKPKKNKKLKQNSPIKKVKIFPKK